MGRKTLYICPAHGIISIRQTEYSSTPDGRKHRTEAIYKAWEDFIFRWSFLTPFLFAAK